MVAHAHRSLPIAVATPLVSLIALVAATGCSDSAAPPREADDLVVLSAPASVGAPGWELIDTIRVRVLDGAGAPLSEASVMWQVTAGNGSVEALDEATDDDGVAAAVWTLGATPGANTLVATGPGDLQATFDVTGKAFAVDQAAAGYAMGCGLVDGAVWCWGMSSWVRSAAPSNPDMFGVVNSSPGLLDDSRDYTAVAISEPKVCALDAAGVTWCATRPNASEPVVPPEAVAGLPALRTIAGAGWGWMNFCGLASSDSTAWCLDHTGAAQVPGSPAFATLAIEGESRFMACGRLADSTAACWGHGPLGDGSENESTTPVTVAGGHHFADVVVGEGFACGRTADGEVWCWGRDMDASHQDLASILTPQLAVTGASAVAANGPFALAVTSAGRVRWSGAGYEPLPYGGLDGMPVADLSSGGCMLLADGQTYCLGEMFNNGSGFMWDEYLPVQPVRP